MIEVNVTICDSDKDSVYKIQRLVNRISEKIQLDIYSSGEEILGQNWYEQKQEIVFLNLKLPDMSGLEVAQRLKDRSKRLIIIFTGSSFQNITELFRVGAFQYLHKPINEEEFYIDFGRAIEAYKKSYNKLLIQWHDKIETIEYNNVYYVEGCNRHLRICTEDKEYESVGTVASIDEKLRIFGIIRCHQSYLVNLGKIKQMDKKDVLLDNGIRIPVSRRYGIELSKAYRLFLEQCII